MPVMSQLDIYCYFLQQFCLAQVNINECDYEYVPVLHILYVNCSILVAHRWQRSRTGFTMGRHNFVEHVTESHRSVRKNHTFTAYSQEE